jgi:hypothetical protein
MTRRLGRFVFSSDTHEERRSGGETLVGER